MPGTDLVAAVVLSRKKHGLDVAAVSEVDYGGKWKAAERRAGFAAHPNFASMMLGLANAVVVASVEDRFGAHFMPVRGLCMLAVLDGHALAAAASGATGKGAPFLQKAAQTRFENRSARGGPALAVGPLGDAATELSARWALQAPEPVRAAAMKAIANALAAGVSLFAKEHGLDPLVLAGLDGKAPPRAKPSAGKQSHVELPKELLAKILGDVDDDAPRLVLADYLSERSDPRGEFIQAQCALGRGTFGAGARYTQRQGAKIPFGSREQLEQLEKTLLKKHEKRWLQPIRSAVREWGFRRGFIERAVCDATKFVDGLEPLSNEPLEKAKLTAFEPRLLERLRRSKPHPTLWLLELSRNRLEAKELELFATPFCSRLRALDLWGNRFGDAGAAALTRFLPASLQRLRLASTDVTTAGLTELARADFWPRLTHLDLAFNERVDAGVVELLASAPQLEWLDLGRADLSGASARAFARLSLPRLKVLRLVGTAMDSRGARAVLDSPGLPALEVLQLPHDVDAKVTAAAEKRFGSNRTSHREAFF